MEDPKEQLIKEEQERHVKQEEVKMEKNKDVKNQEEYMKVECSEKRPSRPQENKMKRGG